MKTYSAKPHEVQHDWYVVDATDKVLGRLATEIARRLRKADDLCMKCPLRADTEVKTFRPVSAGKQEKSGTH